MCLRPLPSRRLWRRQNHAHLPASRPAYLQSTYCRAGPQSADRQRDDPWGEEEKEVIIPAIDELEQAGIQAFGPYAADAFFGNSDYQKFDGVLAMYHDQGMAPLKTLAHDEGVSLATGMPFVCTSLRRACLYDIAGKGMCRRDGFAHAIFTASTCSATA